MSKEPKLDDPIESIELLGCPFCGRSPKQYKIGNRYYLECEGCNCEMSSWDHQNLIKNWNLRYAQHSK